MQELVQCRREIIAKYPDKEVQVYLDSENRDLATEIIVENRLLSHPQKMFGFSISWDQGER